MNNNNENAAYRKNKKNIGVRSMRKGCKTLLTVTVMAGFLGVLSGCAANNIGAPCPNFGSSCQKAPINSWNDNA
jgi:hypothetical protein